MLSPLHSTAGRNARATLLLCSLLLAPFALQAQTEPVDLKAVQQIRTEAFERSQVMETLFWLTDVHGPRLTNSRGFHSAADWAIQQMKTWGLSDPRKESTGPFGRSWDFSRFSAHLLKPQYATLVGFPLAWTPGTNGPVRARVVHAPLQEEADFAAFQGKLKGAIVLIDPIRTTLQAIDPPSTRLSDAALADMDKVNFNTAQPSGSARFENRRPPRSREDAVAFRKRLYAFLKTEGAAVVVTCAPLGDGLTAFGQSAGSREDADFTTPPAIVLAPDHYNRMVRLAAHKIDMEAEIGYEATLTPAADSYNLIADIPGTTKKDEVVMLGGHFDSWHGSTGATDDGAGSAVVMEAMRILKALRLPMKRTVRVALWQGEELGLLGSVAYVKQHYGDHTNMQLKPEHAKLAAYFNYDYGAGRIRGIYLQSNDMLRPIFRAWLEPFADLGASTIARRNATGTDHLAFDSVGLPGFQFIQDSLDYGRTHHSNLDSFDHVSPADLQQSAAIMAAFVYHAANRDEPLPRKPLPAPKPRAY
jgi:hypothetical protein